jgi:long-subunit fatty acid transport protein
MLRWCGFRWAWPVFWFSLSVWVRAVPLAISTPAGTIWVDISHAGPTGQLVEPSPPANAGFRPPTIFAAPLPVGSGARALGQAGAFTAVADDATAASWNPAGLVQLEQPEISAVYRFSEREDEHTSKSRDLTAGEDDYRSRELNYLSAVYPFRLENINSVVSLNYQEAYDYTYSFSARFEGESRRNVDTTINQSFSSSTTNLVNDALRSLMIITDVETDAESLINQVLNSALLSEIDFKQSGTIDAVSPAFALEFSPRFSLGASVNIYTDGASRGNPIESVLSARYSGFSDSLADITETRNSTAYIRWAGEQYGGDPDDPVLIPVSGAQTNTFSDVQNSIQQDLYAVEGHYREKNTTEDFFGINPTLGALWSAGDKLTLGASIDFPWTGSGRQTKQINHEVTTVNSNGVVVASNTYQETSTSDVEYTFPLYWSIGTLWRWNDRFYTSADASCTHWSMYSYKADGGERINPLNGEPRSSSSLDDCWSFRLGGEYLCMLSWTEIPLRSGLFWEQRPAIGSPDEYFGFSLGSGISLGREPYRAILDVAYIFEHGNNVMRSLLPDRSVQSDSTKHQIFISAIWHF